MLTIKCKLIMSKKKLEDNMRACQDILFNNRI